MLEAPLLWLAIAEPLFPPEAPPKALLLLPPEDPETCRLPTRSPPPPTGRVAGLVLAPPPPGRLAVPAPPPGRLAVPAPPPPGRLAIPAPPPPGRLPAPPAGCWRALPPKRFAVFRSPYGALPRCCGLCCHCPPCLLKFALL